MKYTFDIYMYADIPRLTVIRVSHILNDIILL